MAKAYPMRQRKQSKNRVVGIGFTSFNEVSSNLELHHPPKEVVRSLPQNENKKSINTLSWQKLDCRISISKRGDLQQKKFHNSTPDSGDGFG